MRKYLVTGLVIFIGCAKLDIQKPMMPHAKRLCFFDTLYGIQYRYDTIKKCMTCKDSCKTVKIIVEFCPDKLIGL